MSAVARHERRNVESTGNPPLRRMEDYRLRAVETEQTQRAVHSEFLSACGDLSKAINKFKEETGVV